MYKQTHQKFAVPKKKLIVYGKIQYNTRTKGIINSNDSSIYRQFIYSIYVFVCVRFYTENLLVIWPSHSEDTNQFI